MQLRWLAAFTMMTIAAQICAAEEPPRARDLGIAPGVKVGQITFVEGGRVRTGVTAIPAHGGNLFQRVYDPYVGRFLSHDPILQTLVSQALNPFSYVMNNPLALIDPSGYSWQSKGSDLTEFVVDRSYHC